MGVPVLSSLDSESVDAWRSSLDYPPKGSFGNPLEVPTPALSPDPEREWQPAPGD